MLFQIWRINSGLFSGTIEYNPPFFIAQIPIRPVPDKAEYFPIRQASIYSGGISNAINLCNFEKRKSSNFKGQRRAFQYEYVGAGRFWAE